MDSPRPRRCGRIGFRRHQMKKTKPLLASFVQKRVLNPGGTTVTAPGCYHKKHMSQTLPTVVIVGRPNVGKSTLFNRITAERRAIAGDEPDLPRDRLHGLTDYRGRRFQLIDTGAIVVDDAEYIPSQILKQARFALDSAAHIIFLVDGRAEITAPDRDLARMLLRLGRPISLAVNKADTGAREDLAHDFYSLGIRDIFPVSSEHGIGVDALVDHVTAGFGAPSDTASGE